MIWIRHGAELIRVAAGMGGRKGKLTVEIGETGAES
jgi:hypothetical protein